jgi:hypothetical protein
MDWELTMQHMCTADPRAKLNVAQKCCMALAQKRFTELKACYRLLSPLSPAVLS